MASASSSNPSLRAIHSAPGASPASNAISISLRISLYQKSLSYGFQGIGGMTT